MPDATTDVYDITIIGAGPTGLFGAFYAGLRELKVKIIDALPQMGGQLIALYPEKQIFDTPGFFAIRSKELVDHLAKQANESVARFEGKGVVYLVSDLQAYAGQHVLIIGGGDSAVDWALALDKISEKVTLIHRREGFRAHDSSVNALKAA